MAHSDGNNPGIPASYDVIVVGGGHAGAEAAWAASRMLAPSGGRVALITMDPSKTGAMSCNPAIGGLAKGQMVREIDALGGLMGLAADATGIQFKMLNASKGPAVRGPRCQSDKYAYAEEVQRLLGTRQNLDILAGTVDDILIEQGQITGVIYKRPARIDDTVVNSRPTDQRGNGDMLGMDCCSEFGAPENDRRPRRDNQPASGKLKTRAVVLTTGTFMRALMHTGEEKTEGGRIGEQSAVGISGTLKRLGLELGRLKTGTPPRLAAETIDFKNLEPQPGDQNPTPFSELTQSFDGTADHERSGLDPAYRMIAGRFPRMEQVSCWITHTHQSAHDVIRENLDRAPIFNGQIGTPGPRYCPSIEDKVVRFADRQSHHVFLEPESLRTNEIYCNGISTSLPSDVQDLIVRTLPGCENAKILRYGYAVEYDMVRPHQIDATCMVKRYEGLFLAGQINGTSGYEEAAGQGLLAGINAVRLIRGDSLLRLGRDQAYLGVLLDDLITKTPVEPYRMFTSRAEFRLLLRADNAADRLTEIGRDLGLVDDQRWTLFKSRQSAEKSLIEFLSEQQCDAELRSDKGLPKLVDWARRPDVSLADVLPKLDDRLPDNARDPRRVAKVLSDLQYAGFIDRQRAEVARLNAMEDSPLPTDYDYAEVGGLRKEAAHALNRFKPSTVGQATRLEGVTPADVMLLTVALRQRSGNGSGKGSGDRSRGRS